MVFSLWLPPPLPLISGFSQSAHHTNVTCFPQLWHVAHRWQHLVTTATTITGPLLLSLCYICCVPLSTVGDNSFILLLWSWPTPYSGDLNGFAKFKLFMIFLQQSLLIGFTLIIAITNKSISQLLTLSRGTYRIMRKLSKFGDKIDNQFSFLLTTSFSMHPSTWLSPHLFHLGWKSFGLE